METFFPSIVSYIKKVLNVGDQWMPDGCGCPENSGLWLPSAVNACGCAWLAACG